MDHLHVLHLTLADGTQKVFSLIEKIDGPGRSQHVFKSRFSFVQSVVKYIGELKVASGKVNSYTIAPAAPPSAEYGEQVCEACDHITTDIRIDPVFGVMLSTPAL